MAASQHELSLFGNSYDVGIGWHNIGTVLRGAKSSVSESVANHYGQRCGHIPPGEKVGILVPETTPVIRAQIEYLSHVTHQQIAIYTLSDPLPSGALVAPYINTQSTAEFIREKGARDWGLHPVLVEALKNKAAFHELVTNLAIHGVTVPEHTICDVQELQTACLKLAKDTHDSYTAVGCHNIYPVGLMIRAAESDGNYGGCSLKHNLTRNSVIFTSESESTELASWQDAIAKAHSYIEDSIDRNKEPRVVVSRLIDKLDSPGVSLMIQNGRMEHLGWNGQVVEPGGTACIGTGSYSPNSPELIKIHSQAEAESVEGLYRFLIATSRYLGIPIDQITGMVNFDLMIPGPMEQKYQQRLGNKAQILLAECNPRWTNYSDALALVAHALNFSLTTEGMRQVRDLGVLTQDKFKGNIREGVTVDQIRDTTLKVDRDLSRTGSRVILRMAVPKTPGFVIAGDTHHAQTQLTKSLEAL
jgi:hypothetical protein